MSQSCIFSSQINHSEEEATMGIKQLMKLITEEAPGALKEKEMENLNDRKVAIDASMAIYQFLVAVRSSGPGGGQASMQLTNENGDVTSHIQGMFNRTIKMMETGVKPMYVFDGKPPQMKGGELAKRLAKRAKAEADLAVATEAGEMDDMDKYSRRLVKATRQHSEECKELLALMGVPFMTAPCEAEAQCAELARKGKVGNVLVLDGLPISQS
jgi:flap endonuclease-1